MMTNYPILGVIGIALIYPVSASAQDALDEIAGNADHNKIISELRQNPKFFMSYDPEIV